MSNHESKELDHANDTDVKINLDLLPEYQRCLLAEFALDLTRDIFSRPGEEERFQQWLISRQERNHP